jgi:hypothetical protein
MQDLKNLIVTSLATLTLIPALAFSAPQEHVAPPAHGKARATQESPQNTRQPGRRSTFRRAQVQDASSNRKIELQEQVGKLSERRALLKRRIAALKEAQSNQAQLSEAARIKAARIKAARAKAAKRVGQVHRRGANAERGRVQQKHGAGRTRHKTGSSGGRGLATRGQNKRLGGQRAKVQRVPWSARP